MTWLHEMRRTHINEKNHKKESGNHFHFAAADDDGNDF